MPLLSLLTLALAASALASPGVSRRAARKCRPKSPKNVSTSSSNTTTVDLPSDGEGVAPTLNNTNGPGASITPASAVTTPTTTNARTDTPLPVAASNVHGSTPRGAAQGLKAVFAHFMVGIVSTYAQQDWEKDMRLAKSYGITGFALNIGVDPYTEPQLDLAYAAGKAVDFPVFISFDFNWYKLGDVDKVTALINKYVDQPAQYKVKGQAFVSTFIGEGFDWAKVARDSGKQLYVVPCLPSTNDMTTEGLSGLFSWKAWPGQINNIPVDSDITTVDDEAYIAAAKAANKVYMAPVSPWFFTHFGPKVPYAKNWLFKSETLWVDRWQQILALGEDLNFLEIVTWNDYGESHHVAPVDTPHTDDGASEWAVGLDHVPMLDLARPFISAFKNGQKAVTVNPGEERAVYWYRPHLKDASCDATDSCKGKPKGWEFVRDSVFITTLTSDGGNVTVTSGSNAPVTLNVKAGVDVVEVPMGVGKQHFAISTPHGFTDTTSSVSISDQCWNGNYNFNFHSGTSTIST